MEKKPQLNKHIYRFLPNGRTWKSYLFRIFLSLLIIPFVLYFCTQIDVRNREDILHDHNSNIVSLSKSSCESYIQFFSYIVKSGDTFAGILSKFNIPEKQAVNYYSSFKSVGFHTLVTQWW